MKSSKRLDDGKFVTQKRPGKNGKKMQSSFYKNRGGETRLDELAPFRVSTESK